MKRLMYDKVPIIYVTMYLTPLVYEDSTVLGAITFDPKTRQYHTDVNPSRIINGPLSAPGEALEPPIKDEWSSFVDDCKHLINEVGFTIMFQQRSDTSEKSEYFITFGLNDRPCGSIVYDLRLSDHPFDASFPEEAKDAALEYLQMNNILNGEATKAGIDFQVEKVTIGSVKHDSWDRAFNRLYKLLRRMRSNVRVRINREDNK